MILSLIIPCFNEEKNIPIILDRFEKIVENKKIEVLLVNNGSTDGSLKLLNALIPKYKFAKFIDIKINKGYGYGIMSGLLKAKGKYVGYTHADLQTDPNDLLRAYKLIINQNNPEFSFIKGYRKNRPFFDQFFSIGMGLFESIYLWVPLWEINAQPNLFSRGFLEIIKNEAPDDFSFDLFLLYIAKKNGYNVVRFDVKFPKRIYGVSSWNKGLISKWKFIKRTINYSIKLKKDL